MEVPARGRGGVPGAVLGAMLPVTPSATAQPFRRISLTARWLQGRRFPKSWGGDPIVAKGLFAGRVIRTRRNTSLLALPRTRECARREPGPVQERA